MDRAHFTSVKRIEDKYVVSKQVASDLEDEAKSRLDAAYPDKTTKWTLVKSTYLDSHDCEFYCDHINNKSSRVKLRVRSYAPGGKWDDRFFLEIKGKEDKDVFKDRIELDASNKKSILDGKTLDISKALTSANSELLTKEELTKFVTRVNAAVTEYKLIPIVSVTYRRVAYEKNGFRITMDRDLSMKDEGGLSQKDRSAIVANVDFKKAKELAVKYDPNQNSILEVKHQGVVPNWADRFIDDHGLDGTRFSKYVWGMYKLLTRDMGSNVKSGSPIFQALVGVKRSPLGAAL